MSNRPPRHISRIIILQKKMTFSTNFGAPLQISQLTFTCSKSTTETLEKGVKYVQSFDVIVAVLMFLLSTLNIFHTFSKCPYSLLCLYCLSCPDHVFY